MRKPEKGKTLRSHKIKRKSVRLSKVLHKSDSIEYSKRPSTDDRLSTDGDAKLPELVQVQDKCTLEYPIFIKPLCKSNVSGGFWMRIPVQFGKKHLPRNDTIMVLETENGWRYNTKYLSQHCGLSGGWKKYAKDEKLEEGDVMVFHLVEAARFKVYVIRRNESSGVGELISFHNSNTHPKERLSDQRLEAHQPSETKSWSVDVQFINLASFEKFKTVISNFLQNHDLPDHVLSTYYQLCCSQSAFLHGNLFKDINLKMRHTIIRGTFKDILFEIVDIANALRTCKLSTFLDGQSASWDRTLDCHEALGMNVKFLRARLGRLQSIAVHAEVSGKKYEEASFERVRSEDEVRKLKDILTELRKISDKHPRAYDEIRKLEALIDEFGKFFISYDAELERLKSEVEDQEIKFQEEAAAPW